MCADHSAEGCAHIDGAARCSSACLLLATAEQQYGALDGHLAMS